jgi:Arc/MetJ-type ribon-helix-helix transcriptional regulator
MKFSANIPDDLLVFLDDQVSEGRYRSRSAALTEALRLWRQHTLTTAYADAFQTADTAWDVTLEDGVWQGPTP